MHRRMRRGTVGLVLAALALTGASCTLNKGTAFEQQFTPFMEERDRLESFDVSASNDLPGYGSGTVDVVLDDDLDDDEIVEEIFQIAHHEVDDQVGYDLHAVFTTENGSGEIVPTSVFVNVHAPMPDTDENRQLIADRVERGRAIAAADAGLQEFTAGSYRSSISTTSDPLEVAQVLQPILEEADELETVVISRGEEPSAADRVEMRVDLGFDGLADLVAVLELVRQSAPVTRYVAETAARGQSATLTLDLATLPADPRPLVDAASARDVALVLPTPAPVTPDPAASPPAP